MRYSPIRNRYLNILLAVLLAGLFTFSSLPPSPRALAATSASNVTLTSTTIATVNGTGTTDLIVNGISGTSGLAAYEINITFDSTKIKVVAPIEGYSPFAGVTSNAGSPNPATDANTSGTLRMNSFHANPSGPTGTVKLATITWTAVTAGTFPLTLTKMDITNVEGNVITGAVPVNASITVSQQPGATPTPATPTPATPTPGPTTPAPATPVPGTPAPGTPAPATPAPTTSPTTVPIATSTPSSAPTPAGTYVEVGSATVAANASVQIPVTVKNITARSGFGSYDFQVSFNPQGFKVENIKPGDQPFGEPAASNINNSSGKIFINDFSDKVPGPTGNVIAFYLTVTGLASGSWPVSVTVTTLSAANGDDVTATVLPGTITVTGGPAPSTATPPPTAAPTPVVTPAPTAPPTSKPTTPPPPPTQQPTPPATQPPASPPATPKPATPAPTLAPTPVPTPTPEPGPNLPLIIGVIVLVIVVIVVIVLVTKKKPEMPAPPPPPAPKK